MNDDYSPSTDDDVQEGSSSSTRRRRPRQRTTSHGSFTTDNEVDPGEQHVEDVTIKFFYQPRTLTLLCCMILAMFYFAFTRDPFQNQHDNFWHGFIAVIAVFFVISLLICPNGPFVRPHPAVWRVVLGASIMYNLCLVFAIFQSYQDILSMFQHLDPKLAVAKPDTEVYAEDCSLHVIWSRIDVFVVAHFVGWAVKALMLRHAGLLWLLSITWEFTELAFAHLLENFKECWWDSILLDVLICNGLGIHFGLYICKKLEIRQFHWESIKDIRGTSKKLRRAVLQFTPISWTEVRWFDPKCVKMRYTSLCALCIVWQIAELNTFFLKHIFIIPTHHWLNLVRLTLLCLVTMPTLRQYYLYVTDTRCTRVGTQCWMFICITFLEAILCIRHALTLFSRTEVLQLVWWIAFQLFCCLCLMYFLLMWGKRKSTKDEEESALKSQSHLRFQGDCKAYEGDEEEDTESVRKRKTLHKKSSKAT